MAADDLATVRAVSTLREDLGAVVRAHSGRLVDFTGDNFLAEFASALGAVRCAIALQHALEARNRALPPGRALLFRIGVHLGDVLVEGERIYGEPVNAAERIQSLALSGGICLSSAVVEQVRHHLSEPLEDLGPRWLKNLPEPVHVFRLRPGTETEAAQRQALAGSGRAERRLSALLVCDGAGYAKMTATDEDAAFEALVDVQDTLAPLVRQHGGRVIDVVGDGLSAEFATATAALRCALAIQTAVERANAAGVAERRLALRIGVHLDEVIVRGERLYGHGVNLTHRLARLAPGGEIYLTGRVLEHVAGKLELAFEERGEHLLAESNRPVRVLQVLRQSGSA
jgi:class 3 adenylate cyclase